MRNLAGRSVTLDFVAEDSEGHIYNIEVQNSADEDYFGPKRTRLHQSLLDSSFAEKGGTFKDLPELYIIFITPFNPLKKYNKNSIAYYTKTVIAEDVIWDNGVHEIYINAEALEDNDESELAELMRYFKRADPFDMRFGPLSEAVAYCKNNEKEIDYMYDLVQSYAQKYAQEYSKEREALAEARGKAEGIKEGIKEGKAEGENKKAVEVVRNLLNRGIKPEEAFLIANIDAKTYRDYSAGL